jgi:hypothetical protein
MRLNDACNLRWRDIDLVSPIKTITYEPHKTGEAVTLAAHPTLEDYLLNLPAPDNEDDFVFPSLAQRKNVSPLSKAFRKIMQRRALRKPLSASASRKGAAFTATASTHCGIPSRQSSPTTTSLKKSGCDCDAAPDSVVCITSFTLPSWRDCFQTLRQSESGVGQRKLSSRCFLPLFQA